jgi:hypothetical protein
MKCKGIAPRLQKIFWRADAQRDATRPFFKGEGVDAGPMLPPGSQGRSPVGKFLLTVEGHLNK